MSVITLNEQQQEALEFLKNFVKKSRNFYALLDGSAGTGKTTTINSFVKWLKMDSLYERVALCAPTHKAVKIMREMNTIPGIKFHTLHSLLGLKHKITNDGREVFERDKWDESKFHMYDFIIVDEASMISDQLFKELDKQNELGIKVLFVGDKNQINPINHEHSIPMIENQREKYEIGRTSLSKIVRQAEGNPIIALSQQILKNEFELTPGVIRSCDGNLIEMIDKADSSRIISLLKEYFVNEKFDKNGDFCRVLAWKNKTVDYFNSVIRKFKYGKDCGKIVLSEKLIVDRPIKAFVKYDEELEGLDGTSIDIMFHTNEDLFVKEVKVSSKVIHNIEFKYYDTLVEGDTKEKTIHILHEDSESDYQRILNLLMNDAKKETNGLKRSQKWVRYYRFMENFASVQYAYACTVHVSQGSTYDNAIVFVSDIESNRNELERKRILYTAVTRPRHNLFLF